MERTLEQAEVDPVGIKVPLILQVLATGSKFKMIRVDAAQLQGRNGRLDHGILSLGSYSPLSVFQLILASGWEPNEIAVGARPRG